MRQLASLRTFSKEELLMVLCECSHHLSLAYQDTLDKNLWDTSFTASMACDFLRYELSRTNQNFQLQ